MLIVKPTLLLPAGIVTEAGTVATLVFALDRVMIAPPMGAALTAVTVPLVLLPATGAFDLITNELKLTVCAVLSDGIEMTHTPITIASRPDLYILYLPIAYSSFG